MNIQNNFFTLKQSFTATSWGTSTHDKSLSDQIKSLASVGYYHAASAFMISQVSMWNPTKIYMSMWSLISVYSNSSSFLANLALFSLTACIVFDWLIMVIYSRWIVYRINIAHMMHSRPCDLLIPAWLFLFLLCKNITQEVMHSLRRICKLHQGYF